MADAIRDTFKRPLRDLRISVTDRCNFRCAYCMPAEIFGEHYRFLPRAEILTFEEITRLTGIIVRLGAVKLRITGGEPLVREQVETLIGMLRPIEGVDDLTLTTNGFLLPQKAQLLKDAGLNRITVSLDSLDASAAGSAPMNVVPTGVSSSTWTLPTALVPVLRTTNV